MQMKVNGKRYPKSVPVGSAVTTEQAARPPADVRTVRGLTDVDIEWEEWKGKVDSDEPKPDTEPIPGREGTELP